MEVIVEQLRTGAQVIVLHCMEPAMNTPEAQEMMDKFLTPIILFHGLQVDAGADGRPRWLKDRLQLPGIIRRYGEDYRGWREAVVHDSLELAVSAHGPEMIALVEHTNCGERLEFAKQHDRVAMSAASIERIMIGFALGRADGLLTNWHLRRSEGKTTGRLIIVRAVGIVSSSHVAAERRLQRIITLGEFLAG